MVQTIMPVTLDASALLLAWGLSVPTIFIQWAVIRRIRASDRDAGFMWWVLGALCLGTGVWAGCFIGVLSFRLPMAHGYVLSLIGASWLPAVMACGVAIWLGSHTRLPMTQSLVGSAIIAGAVGGVLMLSVSSILLKPALQWQPAWVAGGMAVTLLAGAAGQTIRRHCLRLPASAPRDLGLCAVVATLFCVGQLLLLLSVAFPAHAVSLGDDALSSTRLVPTLGAVTVLVYVLIYLGTRIDERNHHRQAQLSESLALAQDELHHASHHDHLTSLYNRLGFDMRLERALDAGAGKLAVMLINLDGFKPLVHHFGHAVGEVLLRQVGARLQAMVRSEDVVARGEGDEYLLLFTDPGDAHTLTQMAQRVIDTIREPFLIEQGEIELSCSIGVSQYPEEPNPQRLVDHANEAMLTARSAGGSVHCLFQSGMERVVEHQVAMQRDLRHAVQRNEMMLYYQPKIDGVTGQLVGVEALLRWRHPERGMVSPAEFIPVAERFGLIGELGTWVLEEACRQARAWMDAGVEIAVAVNVSVHQLRQADLEAKVRHALSAHQIPPRLLVLEITESVAMENIEASLKVFDMLDGIGVQLSIDDFGTGYSSLSYLRRLPASQLKIDRCFVRDLDGAGPGQDARAIVEAVVRLAHALNLTVVAEGVETEAQAQILRELGCDELQGFLFARPMPEFELLAWQVQRQTGARLVPPRPAAPQAEARVVSISGGLWAI